MAPPRRSLPLRRRRVSQRRSELCATLDTTQDAAHFACGTSYELVRKGKTDEAAHSSVPPRRPARTVAGGRAPARDHPPAPSPALWSGPPRRGVISSEWLPGAFRGSDRPQCWKAARERVEEI